MEQFDASNRKDVRRAQKRAKQAAARRRATVATIMGTIGGREWMHDTLASCGCFHTTFTGEAMSSAFNEGKRAIGLSMLADIMQSCPDEYVTMMREANDRDAADAARSATNDRDKTGGDYTDDAGDYTDIFDGEEDRGQTVTVERG